MGIMGSCIMEENDELFFLEIGFENLRYRFYYEILRFELILYVLILFFVFWCLIVVYVIVFGL